MRPGCRAWVALGVGVAVWDACCPPGEQLTDAARRGVVAHPVLTTGAIAMTALHLANRIAPCVDPIHLLAAGLARVSVAAAIKH